MVLPLADDAATLPAVGGKGASLARLARAGFSVPDGFHLTTSAYQRFVERNGLAPRIQAALDEGSTDGVDSPAADGSSPETASRRIAELFRRGDLPAEIAAPLGDAYRALGDTVVVAVRSSATAEDLPGLSFAGQQDTVLNVRGTAALHDAVRRCWASLWTARAIAYRRRNHVDTATGGLAVVVQRLVNAEASGVLFTADPVSGARERLTINAAWGLGESLVGGEVTADSLVIDRGSQMVLTRTVGDKSVMTVLAEGGGTTQASVSAARRHVPVLTDEQVLRLVQTGLDIERLYGRPMDVEWALSNDSLFVVQARPITVGAYDPWNDSYLGDYLWTSGNLGEAAPDVMTPCTWSLMQRVSSDAMADISLPNCPTVGNIGGRCYMNISSLATLASAFGARRRFEASTQEVFGRLPPGLEIPVAPIPRRRLLQALAPVAVQILWRVRRYQSRIGRFVAETPARCDVLRARIAAARTPIELRDLWRDEIDGLYRDACYMLQAAGRQGNAALVMTRPRLQALVGATDADALFAGSHSDEHPLASLGLIRGLQKVASGEIDRAMFAQRYGHRGPHEFEVSMPRPGEDPHWIDSQLELLRTTDVQALFSRREEAGRAAWQRLTATRPPKVVARIRKELDEWSRIERDREATRSELVRVFWVMRNLILRAGELTGRGDDLFMMSMDEIVAELGGSAGLDLSDRRRTYERYRALPAYPRLIRGRFDPFRWAADPHRRVDLFVADAAAMPVSATVSGFPGAAGVVEGRVRVLASPEEGAAFETGEILVTAVTNVGWTPLFPRAAAVVTNVGAPLSHAAIVARELGIPAVVGCGNATMALHTGDLVRVDGSRGMVEVLEPAATP